MDKTVHIIKMGKFVSVTILAFAICGCANVTIPNYIKDINPYKRTFYADYGNVRTVTVEALNRFGWTIESESEPVVFEREREAGEGWQQTLLFTKVRQFSFFLGTRYTRLNVFLRAINTNETEAEIRYLRATSIAFKNFYRYRNDRFVQQIFTDIEEKLDQSLSP